MSDLIQFRIEWLDWEQKCFAISLIRKRDLSAATKAAARRMLKGDGNAGYAHGFFVCRKEEA